ncbi:MAG: hypothetical protein KAG61_03245 [Bacteriovoracaceae bacterium]|nr:hypothetical protein [Bacteriovoracaceae bacterium]
MSKGHSCERCGKRPAGELTLISAWYPNYECEYTGIWLCEACALDGRNHFIEDVIDDL